MAKDERLYARFDIAMDEHPKIALLSDAAFRALFEATMYSRRQLTDGFLDGRVAVRRWGQSVLDELCANDPEKPSLFVTKKRGVAGFQIHDYEKHQTTTADIEAKREAGRRGGLAKASKRLAPASDSLEQNATAPLAITETETEKKIKPSVQPPAERKSEYPKEFEQWWVLYPRKESKGAALRAWQKAKKLVDADVLAKATQAYTLMCLGKEKQFVKLPAGWLNDHKWLDDYSTPSAGRPAAPALGAEGALCVEHPGYPLPCIRCEEVPY